MTTSLKKNAKAFLPKGKYERGISTVQIAIGIMVSVIVLMGAIGGFQYVNQGKVNNEIAAINDMKVAIVKLGQSGPFTAAPTLTVLHRFGVFSNPAFTVTMDNAGLVTAVNNQWGGAVTVARGDDDRLDFTFQSVPAAACVDVGGKLDNIVQTVGVGATPTVTKAANDRTVAATLATACGATGVVRMVYGITR